MLRGYELIDLWNPGITEARLVEDAHAKMTNTRRVVRVGISKSENFWRENRWRVSNERVGSSRGPSNPTRPHAYRNGQTRANGGRKPTAETYSGNLQRPVTDEISLATSFRFPKAVRSLRDAQRVAAAGRMNDESFQAVFTVTADRWATRGTFRG